MIPRPPARPPASPSPPGRTSFPLRLPQLDALRGIAALVVVAHHGYLALPDGDPVRDWCQKIPALAVVTLGRPAVILFFTLSGFVLTLSLADGGGLRYCGRRAARLLPPFWAALCFAALLYACVPQRRAAAFSPWFNGQWDAISARDVFLNLPLLVGPGRFSLDHVVWSLLHELRLSLALPLILLTARRFGATACLAIGAVCASAAEIAIGFAPAAFPTGYHGYLFDAPGLLPSLAISFRFLPAFTLGAVLALQMQRVAFWAEKRPVATLAFGLAGLAALSQRSEYVMTCGSFLIVAVTATSACVARGLAHGPARWLGRVSFSLYLIHIPILLALGLTLDGKLPASTIAAMSVGLSLFCAEVFYVFIERPSLTLGRALTARRSSGPARGHPTSDPPDAAGRRPSIHGSADAEGKVEDRPTPNALAPFGRRLTRDPAESAGSRISSPRGA